MKNFCGSVTKLSVCSLMLLASTISTATDHKRVAKFKITVENVTAGNAVSPFFVVAHASNQSLFKVGKPASPGIAAIAESGDTSVLEEELMGAKGIYATAKPTGGPIFAAKKAVTTIVIPSAQSRTAVISLVAMIGMSNDSFVALPNISLSSLSHHHNKIQLFAENFDAGSEENTGNVEDFGPGGHPVDAAEGFVSYDRGLNPRGNAPDLIAWGSKVAKVTIERVQ